MNVDKIKSYILKEFKDVYVKIAYSEITFFYNKDKKLPNGVYFLTIKEADGPNDKSSNLNREGIFRVSFKPLPKTYEEYFGDRPTRPTKGGFIETKRDLSKKNLWQPHAIYGWMGWTMVLSPTANKFKELLPHIKESYEQAKSNFNKKISKM